MGMIGRVGDGLGACRVAVTTGKACPPFVIPDLIGEQAPHVSHVRDMARWNPLSFVLRQEKVDPDQVRGDEGERMTTELTVLAWGCLLAIVHIWLPIRAKTAQYGIKWNMGARDEAQAPPSPLAGRLARAQANFFETFPLMIAAVAIVSIADLETRWTAIGALLWLGARVIYLPLYAFGVPVVRTLAWTASVVGIADGVVAGAPGRASSPKKNRRPLCTDAGFSSLTGMSSGDLGGRRLPRARAAHSRGPRRSRYNCRRRRPATISCAACR